MDGRIPGVLKAPLAPDTLLKLVQQWCETGEQETRDKIVEHNTRLAIYLARQLAKRFPHLTDELIAEALSGLLIAVERFRHVQRDYAIMPYIVTTIRRRLQTVVQHASVIRVPERTLTRKHDLRQQTTTLTEKDWERLPYVHKVTRLEWEEIVDLASNTPEEKVVFQLTRESYNLREIAHALNRSVSYVGKLRAMLFLRFKYYWLLGEDDVQSGTDKQSSSRH